jgi:hypothetical protein
MVIYIHTYSVENGYASSRYTLHQDSLREDAMRASQNADVIATQDGHPTFLRGALQSLSTIWSTIVPLLGIL